MKRGSGPPANINLYLFTAITTLMFLFIVVQGLDQGPMIDKGDWDTFRGDPAHSGRSNISLSGNNGKMVMIFKAEGPIYSSPVISVDGSIIVGSLDRSVYSIHPNGTLKWKFETGGAVYSSASISEDGSVIIGSMDGNLYSIDGDGDLNWKYGTGGGIRSSPVIGPNGRIFFGSRDDNLYCVDGDGDFYFQYMTGGDVDSSPALASDGRILVGSDDGCLHCVDSEGKGIWTYETESWVYSSPSIDADGSVVFGSDDGYVYKLHENGSLNWRLFTGNDVYSSPSLGPDGRIVTGTDNDTILAIAPNGSELWFFEMGDDVFSSPLVGRDGRILSADRSGRIVCLSENGSMIWERDVQSSVSSSSPGIDDSGTIYVGTMDGRLIGIGRDTGPPDLISDDSDLSAKTGDPFNLSVSVTDDNYLENIRVSAEYWFGTGDHVTAGMDRIGQEFKCILEIPNNSLDHLFYRFMAEDLEGQRSYFPGPFSSQMVTVIDDEDPQILEWRIGNCTTGDPVEIEVKARDNVEVAWAVLHWEHGENSAYKSFLERSFDDTFRTVVAFAHSMEPFEYWIEAIDSSGNNASTPLLTADVRDNDPPEFSDNSPKTMLMDQPYTFDIDIWDNMGGVLVSIEFILGNNQGDFTIPGNGQYSWYPLPFEYGISSLMYRITVTDGSGNNITGEWTEVRILNDSGPGISLLPQAGPTTGDPYRLEAKMIHAIPESVFVEYWFGDGPGSFEWMNHSGEIFSLIIDIPENSTDSLFVKINGTNPDGFSNTLGPIELYVTDNDSPSLTSMILPSECGTGNDLVINVTAEDNIGVELLAVEFGFGELVTDNLTFEGAGPYSFSIPVPSSFIGELHISFVVEDVFGNRETSEIFGVHVKDDDPPNIVSDLTPSSVKTGDELVFKAEVSDNIMVESVHVVFRIENGTEEEIELTDSGHYTAGIRAPDEGGNLYYHFRAMDSSGNIIETPEKSIQVEKEKNVSDESSVSPLIIILGVVVLLAIFILAVYLLSRRGYERGGEE